MAGGLEPDRGGPFPLGATVTVADLDGDPHPLLHRLRAAEPVSWLPALGGWLVTRHDLALAVMRDSRGFTVDDPRFSTAQVVGPSMLSLDGGPHRRHRDPFSAAFRGAAARARLESLATQTAYSLVNELKTAGESRYGGAAELRRGLAGPLAVAVVTGLLDLQGTDPAEVLTWYDAIVTAVTALSADGPGAKEAAAAGRAAFGELRERVVSAVLAPGGGSLLAAAAADGAGLTPDEVASDAAVLMFGGIETTEGMISNAVLHLLGHPAALAAVRADRSVLPAAVAESLRLEPAAAVVDRYAVADAELGGAPIRHGDLVRVSIAGANRDPAVFDRPDEFDPGRAGGQHNLGFARGPHFCPGAQLASAETAAAVSALLDLLPGLRLADGPPAAPRGLVFRKPRELRVRWDVQAG
ncbi:MAG TPA: cytochrome P450 [Streptosporangiaceae bacterium]|jgi:cytochrome P450|nr:cytochrome P450 [Streptosporangiaceae bacterium]